VSISVRNPPPAVPGRTGARADLLAVAGAVALVAAAAAVGRWSYDGGHEVFLGWPPLLAQWLPHVGPGTPAAVVVAVLVVVHGPGCAQRMRWPALLVTAYLAAVAWTLSLALVDGWQRGVVERLSSRDEYLNDVGRVDDVAAMLRTFTDFVITADQPGAWTTHVAAHPPGAFLFYIGLDRIGLGGGGPAGIVTALVGASACVAVAVAVRALAGEGTARRALPFGVLLPGAVWVGVSADGMFAAVLAWGVALLAVGATGRLRWAAAGGVLLGGALHLSYGLVLGGLVAVAVVVATRRWAAAGVAALGALAVTGAFTAAGFWWFTGLQRTTVIYEASAAAARPYAYFVWANLAAVAFAAGPAVVAGLRRAAAAPRALPVGAVLLAAGGLLALVLADLSGLSKAEVERIWLPFVVWLVVPCALLPRPGRWLAAQAGLALAVNHLLLTVW
jgi:methylthioxylose transferase